MKKISVIGFWLLVICSLPMIGSAWLPGGGNSLRVSGKIESGHLISIKDGSTVEDGGLAFTDIVTMIGDVSNSYVTVNGINCPFVCMYNGHPNYEYEVDGHHVAVVFFDNYWLLYPYDESSALVSPAKSYLPPQTGYYDIMGQNFDDLNSNWFATNTPENITVNWVDDKHLRSDGSNSKTNLLENISAAGAGNIGAFIGNISNSFVVLHGTTNLNSNILPFFGMLNGKPYYMETAGTDSLYYNANSNYLCWVFFSDGSIEGRNYSISEIPPQDGWVDKYTYEPLDFTIEWYNGNVGLIGIKDGTNCLIKQTAVWTNGAWELQLDEFQ